MNKPKNTRGLDDIADDVHKSERSSLFHIGDLLLEAKAQCEHGRWLEWLDDEFEWSGDTAERYMRVAVLGSRFRKLRNLKLGKTTLYQLANHEPKEELPAIVAELARHASKQRLAPYDAERVISVGIARYRFGDHPDATLAALAHLDSSSDKALIDALLKQRPKTEEEAEAIVDALSPTFKPFEDDETGETGADVEKEAEAILAGPPPQLAPPIAPPSEPPRFGIDTAWREMEPFADAVTALYELRAKPTARFVDSCVTADMLQKVIEFLEAVVRAKAATKELKPQ